MDKKNIFLGVVVYLFSVVISYLVFAGIGIGGSITSPVPSATKDASGKSVFDDSLPKTESCPLNGVKYSKQQRKWWESHSPLGIMIENHKEARPQSGLVGSDIIYEAVAEGGITRFLAVFYCQDAGIVGPVRSARTYFLDYISEYGDNPLYAHVGGANTSGPADALSQIEKYGWQSYNDLNQFSIGYPTFVRNANRVGRDVATEHTMETTTEALWEVAADRDWTNIAPERKLGRLTVGGDDWNDTYKGWSFQDEVPEKGTTSNISYEFWEGWSDYGVEWQYAPETNTYKRILAGEPHIDLNNDKQIQASNVIVLLTTEKGPIDELKHMLYTTTGTGNALIFMNGDVVKATWSKPTRESELSFTDRKGEEIEFARGLTWISVADTTTEVTY